MTKGGKANFRRKCKNNFQFETGMLYFKKDGIDEASQWKICVRSDNEKRQILESCHSGIEGRMLVQLLNPSPVSATINKNERIGSLYPLDGKVCSTKALKLHKHNAEDIIEQMVTNAEGLMDEEKDKLRRLLNDAKPIKEAPRRLPFNRRNEVKSLINAMLEKEKDGSTHFGVDFWKVNAATRKDAQPLPRIDDTLDVLGSAQRFSTLDLASGYWQVEVSPEDQHGFKTDPEKTRCVADWPTPSNANEMRQFLGLAGYYIDNLSRLNFTMIAASRSTESQQT
ncbi:hypothetical protein EMCRGX_G004343 [Ephydatia muelleri]